ncbi:hypothetical protein BBP40_008845 [Aspergillus hancockii]|nr:hypothetical protein BBP40_008845 [Aspergillus hancockii]
MASTTPSASPSVSTCLNDLASVISNTVRLLQSTAPPGTAEARATLSEACHRMLTVAMGPAEILKQMVLIDRQNLASLQIINHYEIASIVPPTGTISIPEVAQKCGLPIDILSRILRQAMTYGAFSEPEPGHIAQTDVSREIPRLSPMLSYQLEVCLPSMVRLLDWLKDQDREHKSAFQIAHNTTDNWWVYACKRPELIQNYGKYMALITTGGAHDVGGASGLVGITLAETHPEMFIIVEDNIKLKTDADANIPVHLKSQVMFLPHSFFKPQPALGQCADVFLLRHILHDWNDENCRGILRSLAASMKPGASIIVAEQVMERPGAVPWYTNRVMRALDMQMMIQFGSKERTYEDWENLFKSADPSFEIVGCVRPAGSADSFMELKKRS